MFKTCRQKHVPLINKRMSPGLAHQLLCLFACDWLLHWSDDRSPIGCQSMLPSRIVTWSMECMKRNWHSLKIAWLNLAQTNIMSDSAVTVSIRVMTRGGHKVAQAESGVHSQFWWVHQWEFTLLELHQEGQRWARTSTDESGLHSQGWCPDQQITICTCVCAQTQVHVAWTGTRETAEQSWWKSYETRLRSRLSQKDRGKLCTRCWFIIGHCSTCPFGR